MAERRFTSDDLARTRAAGVFSADEAVELCEGRLTVGGRPRPIWPDEAMRMVDAEIFAPDERLELIEGELWTVSPQGEEHAFVLRRLNALLSAAYAGRAEVGMQLPARVTGPSLPEPDLAVSRPLEEVRHVRADDLLLVVEVMVSSHGHDARKSPIYAAAGVPELWLVDVPARIVTALSDPRPDGTWGTRREVRDGESLAVPQTGATLTPAQVLPPA